MSDKGIHNMPGLTVRQALDKSKANGNKIDVTCTTKSSTDDKDNTKTMETLIGSLRNRYQGQDLAIFIVFDDEAIGRQTLDKAITFLEDINEVTPWATKERFATGEVDIYVTRNKAAYIEYVAVAQVITIQQGFSDEVYERKIDFILSNDVEYVAVTVETLRNIFDEEGNQLYLLKDGHHKMVAAFEQKLPIIFVVDDNKDDLNKTGIELLTNIRDTCLLQGNTELYPHWAQEYIYNNCENKKSKKNTKVINTIPKCVYEVIGYKNEDFSESDNF